MLPQITEGIVGIINGLIPLIPEILSALLPGVVDGAVQLIDGLVKVLPDLINMLAPMLPQIINSLASGLVIIIQTLAEMLPELMPVIVDAILSVIPVLLDNLPLLINAGFQLLGGLIAGIINSIPVLLARVGEIATKMLQAFKKINLKDIGKNLLKGLWNGIQSMKDWVIEKVKSIGKSILKGLKSVLGIHSPSTEFAMIGKFSVLGYTEQLDKMKKDIQSQVAETFQVSPQLANSSSLHFSPNIINNNYVDIQQDPLGQMVNNIKSFSGGAKNDYNYGAGY